MKIWSMGLGSLFLTVLGFQTAVAQPAVEKAKIATNSTEDSIHCRVVWEVLDKSHGLTRWDHATEVRVAVSELDRLPTTPPAPSKPVSSQFGLQDFDGKIVNRVKTKEGILFETFEGHFTSVVADEKYVPFANKYTLKPDIKPGTSWPSVAEGSPEMITAEIPEQGLRAIWWRPRVQTASTPPPLSDQYFAVEVQLYERRYAIRSATFTGRKTVEKDALIFKNKTTYDLKNTPIHFDDTEWKLVDGIGEVKAVAFRFK